MNALRHDLRLGLRALRRTPGTTLAILASLGLGIGAVATAVPPDLPFLDPRSMTQQMVPATIVLLAGVAATASILPARRAARVDPVVALDGE